MALRLCLIVPENDVPFFFVEILRFRLEGTIHPALAGTALEFHHLNRRVIFDQIRFI